LESLVRAVRRDAVPRRAVVVTLDDGYADNLRNAEPLLRRHDVPATCFLTAGLLGLRRFFWWDELARHLLLPGAVSGPLRLRVRGELREWELGAGRRYTEANRQRDRRWRPWNGHEATSRQALYLELFALLRPLVPEEREAAMEELRAWTGRRDEPS